MLNGKYIVFRKMNPVCFPESLSHKEVAHQMKNLCGEPTSAGFFYIDSDGRFCAYGVSTSLGIESQAEEDSRLMNFNFGVDK